MNKKKKITIFAAVTAIVLALCLSIGGVSAYLTATPTGGNSLENTFIARSGLLQDASTFKLTETKTIISLDGNSYVAAKDVGEGNYEIAGVGDEVAITTTGNTYSDLIAGMTLLKDPVVEFGTTTSTTYLFVKVVESNIPVGVLDYDYNTEKFEDITEAVKTAGGTVAAGTKIFVYKTANNNIIDKGATVEESIIDGNEVRVLDSNDLASMTNAKIIFSAYLTQTAGFASAAEAFVGCGYAE